MPDIRFYYQFSKMCDPAELGGNRGDIAIEAMGLMQDCLEDANGDLALAKQLWYGPTKNRRSLGGTFEVALASHKLMVKDCLALGNYDKDAAREIWNGLFEGSHGFDTAHDIYQAAQPAATPTASFTLDF